jgi:hypothetical protein
LSAVTAPTKKEYRKRKSFFNVRVFLFLNLRCKFQPLFLSLENTKSAQLCRDNMTQQHRKAWMPQKT